ncbi:metallophosphoesterase family protein [Clostridium sp. BNL1100]|uniref:purple acid phosphatase family protein n=1 Tax=Clostridium sp. BNL1100 TaxID=755731 RepID=UPI00024A77E8|nr:metallophosphoesterase family protein [Clostridium sp. BNL1100]AEY65645.1 putative phosphohydrolase [Clostridium sp. BNL1100]
MKKKSNLFRLTPILAVVLVIFLTFISAHAAVYNALDIALTPGKSISELNISWYSTSRTESLVQIALKSSMTGSEFPADIANSFYCTSNSAASGYYSNKATVTALSPATSYVYRIGDGLGNWSSNYFYTTGSETQFSFFAVGDPQIGAGSIASDTTGWNETITKAINQFPNASFIMSAGDQVNTNNSESNFTGFFSPTNFTSIPLAPALGNHDNGALNYGYHFNLPNISNVYGITSPGSGDYYYTYGNTLFMVLNTNNTSGTTHQTFIKNAVAANPNKTWKIVTFHHDIYGSGSHALESSIIKLRNALYPIFDSYGIDIVITGHDHSYTRTYVMKGNVPQLTQTYDTNGAVVNPSGTVYFTLNSSSGSKYYDLNGTQANYVAVRSQVNAPTFSYVSINGSSLSFDTYRTDSMTKTDSFSIVKK